MRTFEYTAVTDRGERVTNHIQCEDRHEALRRVREMGQRPLTLTSTEEVTGVKRPGFLLGIRTTDLIVFTRQMAALLKAGMPVIKALRTARLQCANKKMARVIAEIDEKMTREACPLTTGLEAFPRVFDAVYRGLVRSGEEGANLEEQLARLATHLSQTAKLRRQVTGACLYPTFLLCLGTSAVFVLMSFVIPRFEQLFESAGRELPWVTRMLIDLSGFLASWWWALIIAVVAGASLMGFGMRRPVVREHWHRGLLLLPVFGQLCVKLEVSRAARTLSALLQGRVPILDAVEMTQESLRNLTMRRTLVEVRRGVASGESLADEMAKSGWYPPMVVDLVSVGEHTGDLPQMLEELAEIYESEAEQAVAGAVKLVEPLLILVMGLVIAGIVAAVILPVFQSSAFIGS